jgi:hypothetical protein
VLWLKYKRNGVQCAVRNDGIGTSQFKESIWDVRSCHRGIKMELVRKITEDIMEMVGSFDVEGKD